MKAEDRRKVELSWMLPHPPAKVWRALTEPELVAQWIMETDLKPELGHRFAFKGQPAPGMNLLIQSEVVELEPGRRIAYTWGSGGPDGLDSRVTWTLTPIAGGTRLALEHSGFKPSQSAAFAGAGKGWDQKVSEKMIKVLASL